MDGGRIRRRRDSTVPGVAPEPPAGGDELFELLERVGAARCTFLVDPACGLRAVLILDDVTLGPAAGGVRTRKYPTVEAAVRDCAELARAMTYKCALAGLAAGGGKLVVLAHPGLDRPRAFARLGELVDQLGGLFRTAGDLGTTGADLEAMAGRCRYVETDERGVSAAVARGVLRGVEACAAVRGARVADLRVAVQGCGAIGEAVAEGLAAAGARLVVADVDMGRAQALAARFGADVRDADAVLRAEVDVLSPCAVGGLLTRAAVDGLRAWAVCGAANNILADATVDERLRERDILFVPDIVASAGGVIEGIGRAVMGLADRAPLIDALGDLARDLLRESAATGQSTTALAAARARARLAAARA